MSERISHRIAIKKLARRQQSRTVYSISVERMLRKSYGRNRMGFFELYPRIRDVYEGIKQPPEDGFASTFRSMARQIRRRLTQDKTKYQFREKGGELLSLLRRLDRDPTSRRLVRRIIPAYADLIEMCANDHDIFLDRRKLRRPGWIRFTKARSNDAELQKLKRDDPATYETVKRERELRKKLHEEIESTIVDAGLEPTKKKIRNKVVNVGVDPVTDEEIVYSAEGDVLPIDEYVKKLDRKREEMNQLRRIHPDKNFVEDLRSVPEDVVDEYRDMSEVEYTALTDDEKENNQGTRIYPVQEIQGEKVIVKGEFKGYKLADVVNRTGRLIRGISYDVDPKTGASYSVETRNDDGEFDVRYKGDRRKRHDPYVTVCPDTGDLFLKVASGREWTDIRRAARSVTDVSPDAEYVEGTSNSTFRFKPEEFDAMRDACKTMNMSEAAMEKVREHYQEAARVERVTDDEVAENYSVDAIGGFKDDEKDFYRKQKEALAWIEGRGGNGLLGLDTGVGKCITGDTRVLTNQGLVKIEDMNPGLTKSDTDTEMPEESNWKVFVDGSWEDVKSFYYGGEKPTRKLTTHHGIELEGSLVHPVLVRRESGEGFVKTPDLEVGDYVCIERREAEFPAEEVSLNVPVVGDDVHIGSFEYDVPATLNPQLSRLFAYIVAEGTTTSNSYFNLSQCPNKNRDIHDDIKSLLKTQLDWDKSKGREKDWRINSTFLRSYLKLNGIKQCKSAGKEVPDCIFRSTRESIRQFLMGMFEAEASVDGRGQIEFSSASEKLTSDMQQLLLRFGIISNKSQKTVKGYEENDYWRLTLSGEDATLFVEKIGFVSDRKQRITSNRVTSTHNPNLDVIPFANDLVQRMREKLFEIVGGVGNQHGGITKFLGKNTINKVQHIKHGRRDATYDLLGKMIDAMEEVGLDNCDAYFEAVQICDSRYFYDKIVSLENSSEVVMDIEVDHPDHCFVGNGIVNHNTVVAVGYFQNMISKGMLDGPDDKVLYVCPTKLKGNLKGDAKEWVEDYDLFTDKVDVMTYYWFSRAGNANFLNHYPHLEGWGEDIMDYYEAVVFDEAHKLKNPGTSSRGEMANKPHPRKVFMTASPMERDPRELRTLAGMANNEDMLGKEGRRARRNFDKRYCEKLGSRIVGLKDDPDAKRRAKEWAKQNMYYGHKQDVEEVDLPQMRRYNENISMPPALEEKYRETADEISSLIERLNRLYKDFDADAADPEVTGALPKLQDELKRLKELSDMPDLEYPWMSNPKIDRAEELIKEKMETNTRSLLWSSSPDMAEHTAKQLSEKMPGTYHAEGQSDYIQVWKSGQVATEPNGKKMKYTKRRYKDEDGEWTDKDLWAKHIMDTKIKVNPWILTCTLTSAYSTGQNLQEFGQVIHLDRAGNAEEFGQRSARAYRSGQENSVQEHTIDMVYDTELDHEEQETIDSIIRAVREMEEDLFEELVVDSQSVEIGKKYFDMDQIPSSYFESEKRTLELLMSPYLEEYRDEYPSDTNPKANED